MQDRMLRNRVLRGIFHGTKSDSGAKVSGGVLEGVVAAGTGGSAIQAAFAELVRSDSGHSALPLSNAGGLNLRIAGNSAGAQLPEAFGEVAKNLDRLRAVTESQTTTLGENTIAVSSNTAAKSAGQVLASAGKAASGLLGELGGLGGFPLISGIMKLFGGGDSALRQQPLQRYQAPAPIQFDGILQNGGAAENYATGGYDRYGQVRTATATGSGVPGYGQILAAVPQSSGDWNPTTGSAATSARTGDSTGQPMPAPRSAMR